jgi:20S proteasome alpha/beta subunit
MYPVTSLEQRTSTGFAQRFKSATSTTSKPICTRGNRVSILEYNGAAMIAMAGKDCVGVASYRCLLGCQAQTVTCNLLSNVFPMGDKLFIGVAGLATDIQAVLDLLQNRFGLYELNEEQNMLPKVFSHLLLNLMYEKKRFGPYYNEPIIVGLLDENNKTFLCGSDPLAPQSWRRILLSAERALDT